MRNLTIVVAVLQVVCGSAVVLGQGGTGREPVKPPSFTLKRQPRRAPRRRTTNSTTTTPASEPVDPIGDRPQPPTNSTSNPVSGSITTNTAPAYSPPANPTSMVSGGNRVATINSSEFSKGGFISSNMSSDQGRAKIGQSLQEFAKQNGIDLLLDEATSNSAIVVTNDDVDVTDNFIADFNRQNTSNAGAPGPNVALPAGRIAIVDTEAFSDGKTGIRRLVVAYKQLETEFQPRQVELNAMAERIKTLSGSERDALQKEYQRKGEQAQNDFSRRIQEVSGPIQDDINKALDRFARQIGITTVIDSSKLSSALLTTASGTNITPAFITAYNNANSAAAINAPAIVVPNSRLAVIDSNAFADEKTGITRYVRAMNSLNKEFMPRQIEINDLMKRINDLKTQIQQKGNAPSQRDIQQMQEQIDRLQRELKYKGEDAQAAYEKRRNEVTGPIFQDVGKALDAYAIRRGVTLILDASQLSSQILAVSPSVDMTREFISDYNQRNP